MAQYFGVLNPIDKRTPETQQYFTNVNDSESRTIQYVLTQDDHSQQFQQSQIVLATDRLMVVDNQPEVIIDQTQITYQAAPEQFIVEETVSNNQQQIFYMEGTNSNGQVERVVVEQQSQPIVLNHQLTSTNSTVRTPKSVPIANLPAQILVNSSAIRQPQAQNSTRASLIAQARPQMRPPLNNKGVLTQTPRLQQAQNFRRPVQKIHEYQPPAFKNMSTSEEEHEAVALEDGTVVSLTVFKRMQQEKLNPGNVSHTVPTLNPTPPKKGRNPNPNRGKNRSNRGRGNFNQFAPPLVRANSPQTPARYVNQYQMQNQMMQQQRQQQQIRQSQQQSQANYIIQPPHVNTKQQQRPLPSYIPSSQIQKIIENTPVSEEYSDSIRMLVLLANGEQRLITFTLPKEACTIQEILEQVNVPFQHDTKIQVTEANTNGINYIVTVGNVRNFGYDNEEQAEYEEVQPQPQQVVQPSSQEVQQPSPELPKSPSPEPPKEIPRYVPGQLALCAICGYLSEDFNKCMRCKRKLPESVKAIPANFTTLKKSDLKNDKNKSNVGSPRTPGASPPKKKTTRSKIVEHETVVVSSDEEDDEEKKLSKSVNQELLEKLESGSVTLSKVSKEPSIVDIQKHATKGTSTETEEPYASTNIVCRTIRVGSYRVVSPDKVAIDTRGFLMKIPHPFREKELYHIKVDRNEIVKVLVSFQKSLPVIFYYLNPLAAQRIREVLNMSKNSNYYFDPLSDKDESHRRITLLPDDLSEEDKKAFQQIYPPQVLDELTTKEANDILIKTCPKEVAKSALNMGNFTEIKQLLVYPPEGRGRISINSEDYVCLAQDQFLNDVIIDFYLKYVVDHLPKDRQEKVHVFSTFFYKRLTTKPIKASRKSQPAELDPNLTAAQKRHARVKTWTKSVNLFEKDYVIVPINENAHWFLAIICFPGMEGCATMDGQPYSLEPKPTRKKKPASKIESPVPVEKKEKAIVCEDPELSDKDEAEGDDSDLESDDSEEVPTTPPVPVPQLPKVKTVRPPIKQPCILIFDSLAGASRCRVVATLRDYLTCEYKAKLDKEKIFNKDNIKGACPKVPQQTNFTDCGLYLLQYVEQFFQDPIKDFYIPISKLKNWFEEIIVTKKREDISVLIKSLMKEYGKDPGVLPDIMFPTQNGKVIEREFGEEDEDMFEDIGETHCDMEGEYSESLDESASETSHNTSTEKINDEVSLKPTTSSECVNDKKGFVPQTVVNLNLLKPDSSEMPKTTSNRDTLLYLKAKRILRHKNTDQEPGQKKVKTTD